MIKLTYFEKLQTMNNPQFLHISGSWQDWLGMSVYLVMLIFVVWRVILTKPKER